MLIKAVMVRARSFTSRASSKACFSLGAKGQTMASEVTSAPVGAVAMVVQSALMPWPDR